MGLKAFFKEHVIDLGGEDKAPVANEQRTVTGSLPAAMTWQPASIAPAQAGFDPEMIAQLQAVVLKRATPYTALVEASGRLAGIIQDEATRFKAAYATISSGGARTIANISQAIELHCTDLDMEGKRFEQAMNSQLADRVTKVKASADTARAAAQTLTERIADLQRQAAEAQAKITELLGQAASSDAEASAAEAELVAVKQRFDQSVEAVKTDLINKRTYLSTVLV